MTKLLKGLQTQVKGISDSVGVVRNFVWLFGLLIAGGIGGYVGLHRYPLLRIMAVGACAVATGFILGYLIGRTLERRRARPLGYEILSYEIDYTFDSIDPRKHKHVVTIEVKALRDGVGIYEGKYGWSGTGNDAGPQITSGDARIVSAPPVPVTGWRRYYVVFDRPLSKDKTLKFRFEQELFDTAGTFVPFIAKNMDQPVGNLTFRVHFPHNIAPGGTLIACTRSANPTSNEIKSEDEVKLDPREKVVELTIPNPKVGLRYSIEWHWPEYSNLIQQSTN